jgi:hypothetical protein
LPPDTHDLQNRGFTASIWPPRSRSPVVASVCDRDRSHPLPDAAIVESAFGRNFDPSGTDAEFAGCLSVRPIPSPQAPRAWPDRTRAQLKAAPFPCHGGRPLVFLPMLFNSTRAGVGTHKGLGNVALDRGRQRVAVISKNARRLPTGRECESSPCRLISATDANGSSGEAATSVAHKKPRRPLARDFGESCHRAH